LPPGVKVTVLFLALLLGDKRPVLAHAADSTQCCRRPEHRPKCGGKNISVGKKVT